ncbi:MAG: sigma-70 family RNA polymerase sigma factor [Planctomycetales bacterium]|nr:sigma-70 family RNA polymerase sigma factor [Planctomycetales bacterium]
MPTEPWLERVLSGAPGHEQELVERYTAGLLQLARRQLPDRIRRRIDPDDIVQSVYRSFFRRLKGGEFSFQESHDVWKLLAVMTFRKVRNQIKHHRRQQRDSFREVSLPTIGALGTAAEPIDHAPEAADLAIMLDYLEQLLAKLPERHHLVVTLRMEGYSTAEVAERAGVSKRTVLRVLSHLQDLAVELIGADA